MKADPRSKTWTGPSRPSTQRARSTAIRTSRSRDHADHNAPAHHAWNEGGPAPPQDAIDHATVIHALNSTAVGRQQGRDDGPFLAVTANTSTAIVSLSAGGTTWGYLGRAGSKLPNLTSSKVTVTNISTTAVQMVSATAPLTCDSGKAGTLRYNSTNTALQLRTGTGWQVVGVGIPAGTISAFTSMIPRYR